MVKLRIQGTIEEINQFIQELKEKNINILEVSKPYANRGNTSYVRAYLDVELDILAKGKGLIGYDNSSR